MVLAKFQLDSIGLSDIGHLREKNEDLFCIEKDLGLFVLADGMGGRNAGEMAAQMSVESLVSELKLNFDEKMSLDEAISCLIDAYQVANEAIFAQGQSELHYNGMGTTLCALLFLEEKAIISHVGDSRIYLFKNKKLIQLTDDHTLINEYLHGNREGEEAPAKHILSKAIGPFPQIEATIEFCPYNKGDLFLICSDGLSNSLSNREMESLMVQGGTCEEIGRRLLHEALVHGGGDNVTLVLVEVGHDLSG